MSIERAAAARATIPRRPVSEVSIDLCPNCGAALAGPYCSQCGQKRIDEHEYALGHFLSHSLHDLTHLDAKVLGSIVPLLFRPGKVTLDYLEGRRGPYLRPLQTFIIINIIFFFLAAQIHAFGFPTAMYLKYSKERAVLFHWRADALFAAKVQQSHKPAAEVAREIDEHVDHVKRSLLLALIPAFALFVMLVEGTRRKYIEHLIFSIHFYSFWIIVLLAVIGLSLVMRWRNEDLPLLIMSLIIWTYLTIALRRVYGGGWPRQIASGFVLTFSVLLLLYLFRDLLFLAALAMT